MGKKEQRTYIKQLMKELDTEYCKSSDEAMYNTIVQMPGYQAAKCVFCYISVEKEPDTNKILENAWANGKKTVVPRCIGKGIMELCEISSFDDLENGHYNIPEPKSTCRIISPDEIDFGIIPCLSCDRKKNRLGHGGGYYDRYLAGTSFQSVALCRERLLLDEVCMEQYDLPVDFVVSESAIY